MPLFLTWQYLVSLVGALVVTLATSRVGVRTGLTFVALVSIILCLWFLGFHPLGFLVSPGGWLTFLLTVGLSRTLALLAATLATPQTGDKFE